MMLGMYPGIKAPLTLEDLGMDVNRTRARLMRLAVNKKVFRRAHV